MSRDMMRGIGYGVALSGMLDALWTHDRLFVWLWVAYGLWQVVLWRPCLVFGHRFNNDPVGRPFSTRMHICTRCNRIIPRGSERPA